MNQPLGLYIHVPFCKTKCPYCDFYSLTDRSEEQKDAYTEAVLRSLRLWHERLRAPLADTLYFGGGTPSLLGGRRLARILDQARLLFGLSDSEITMEANPGDPLEDVLKAFAASGGNRVSLGMQSSNDRELERLGRRHEAHEVETAVAAANNAGLFNVSLDMMLGVEGQTCDSVRRSVRTAAGLGARHVSAYLLKIEEGTPYSKRYSQPCHARDLPDEDASAELYLCTCEALEACDYQQYEISNFAQPGYSSRHNLKYWNSEPYLGIGPSAHSFINGRRFYYPRDWDAFLRGDKPVSESSDEDEAVCEAIPEASEQEYLLLRLRLTEGVTEEGFTTRFGHALPEEYYERAARLPGSLVKVDDLGIRLTRQGFLVSNALISHLLG